MVSINRACNESDLNAVKEFYILANYKALINENDIIFIARECNKIIGCVRIAYEFNKFVLRGMQVHSSYQQKGVGTKLLMFVSEYLNDKECFVLPYSYLEKFYSKINFVKIANSDAPVHLIKRAIEYNTQGLDVIIMKRNGIAIEFGC